MPVTGISRSSPSAVFECLTNSRRRDKSMLKTLVGQRESLFDFYFAQPAISAKRTAELNVKLKAEGSQS